MTTSDPTGFLAAICADPHDVGLRLIYCDWLEDASDVDRAEFIQVQCELAAIRCTCRDDGTFVNRDPYGYGPRTKEHCDRCSRHALRRCERELLPRMWERRTGNFWGAWEVQEAACGNSRQRPIYGVLHRGFIEAVSCTCDDWLQHGPTIVRCQPVREVTLTDKRPDSYPSWSRPSYHSWLASSLHAAEPSLLPLVLFQALRGGSSALLSGRRDYQARAAALEDLATAALAWARGPHPERGLTALPPLENPS